MNIELGEPSNVNGECDQEAQQGNENISVGVMPGEITANQRENIEEGVSVIPDSVVHAIPPEDGASLERLVGVCNAPKTPV
ncbi:unnamed protein product, partial [Ilex paraguariensis]